MKKGFRWLSYGLLPLFVTIFAIGDSIAMENRGLITSVLGGNTTNFEGEEVDRACAMGDALCREIEQEGIVLLKNGKLADDSDSLPLDSSIKKVNVFGWASTQFLQKGVGSGSSSINPERSINFLQALEEYGISYNKNITSAYTRFSTADITLKNKSEDYNLYLPTKQWHTTSINMSEAQAFSDTAILVLHRVGGENIGEIPLSQTLVTESGMSIDNSRTYLETTKHEEDLIDLLGSNFKNVILVINTTNSMHLGCLKSNKINSAIYVGITGQSGAASIPNVLWGKDKEGNRVSPSGKLTDLYSYSATTSASFANYVHASNHIAYIEDIYYGYKWYETADVEGYWNDINNSYGTGYNGVVQFPFGFGMSYTNFEWSNMQVNLSTEGLTKDTKVTVSVTVKNTGNYVGKDVVELYVSPSYKKGGIEKESIRLVDFAKTKLLEPNETDTVTMSFDAYDIASYDAYDKNSNGFKGYELDYGSNGEYIIQLMTDSHNKKAMSGDNTYTLNVPTEGIKFENDNVTGYPVTNQYTGSDATDGVSSDGKNSDTETIFNDKSAYPYLSRSNFTDLFPKSHAATPNNTTLISKGEKFYSSQYDTEEELNLNPTDSNLRMVTLEDGSSASLEELSGKTSAVLKANLELMNQLGDYNSEVWEILLNQMSRYDLCDLVENGGFHTYPIDTIGKPRAFDTDGPAGFNLNTLSIGEGSDSSKWTAYPSETLVGCTWNKELAEKMGLCMGMEAQATSVQGWYAPGVNIHRTPYTARNYEYYSEDAVLSGVFAARVIEGAKTNGLYCYLKHFVLSEPGPNPRKLNTWVTEQNLRENYLKPFEIAVKKGGANAIMSAFNRVGCTWAGASQATLTNVLRKEWGFKGSVITDYAMTNEEGNMNPTQGVLAGNDLWLNPNDGTISNPLNRNDKRVINAARTACKNIIYTYIDTYLYGSTHTSIFTEYNANVGIAVNAAASEDWVTLLFTIEGLIIALLMVYAGFAIASEVKVFNTKRQALMAANGGVLPKKVKVKREPQPLYITKRLNKMITLVISLGSLTALLFVVLVPLFTQILVPGSNTVKPIPVDMGEVFGNTFEFEQGIVEGKSKGEDHICTAKSYFYNMNLSNSGALDNLDEESTITFKFVSSKNYKVSMNIKMASVFDEMENDYIDANLGDYLSLTVNNEEVSLDGFIIPKSKPSEKLDGTNRYDMNMVNVIGIPVKLSNIMNTYEFKVKENCPALDSFAIYTSADITDYNPINIVDNNLEIINVTEVPTKIKNGSVDISCSHEGCDEHQSCSLPVLSSKQWYAYNEAKNSYEFSVFSKKYIITPDSISKAVGVIHSENKVVKNYSGGNFFQGSNWNHQSSTKQNAADYVYSTADIIDAEGNVVLENSTPAKTKIFLCDNKDRKPLTDYGNAANKDYLGKEMEYRFLVNTTGGFVMTAFGSTYSDANLLVKNSVPGVFYKFDSTGKVSLTVGVDPAKSERNVFRTPANVITAQSSLVMNQDTWISFKFTRHTPELFEVTLFVNDEKVNFPAIPSDASIGDLAYRYTEDGTLFIVQSSAVNHTWGDCIAIAPDSGKVFKFINLEYGFTGK